LYRFSEEVNEIKPKVEEALPQGYSQEDSASEIINIGDKTVIVFFISTTIIKQGSHYN
jgi:hypothetical protein